MHASAPGSYDIITVEAGLLTYSCFGLPSHFILKSNKTVAEVAKANFEITASGNVRDFHLVPFSSSIPIGKEKTLTGVKVRKNNL